MDKCIFCRSEEEVNLIPVDTPTNLQPVCISCYEGFQDACRATVLEAEDD